MKGIKRVGYAKITTISCLLLLLSACGGGGGSGSSSTVEGQSTTNPQPDEANQQPLLGDGAPAATETDPPPPNQEESEPEVASYDDTTQVAADLFLANSGYVANLVVGDTIDITGGMDSSDLKSITNRLYSHFSDSFDFIFVVSNNPEHPAGLYYGQFFSSKNDVTGIGLTEYDYTNLYGSAGKLRGAVHFTYQNCIRNGPALHEIAHAWGNFLFPDMNYYSHWGILGFADHGGQLGGYDAKTLTNDGNTYSATRDSSVSWFGPYANGGNTLPYNSAELYLMGLIPKSEVHDITFASNPVWTSSDSFSADSITTKPFAQALTDAGRPDRTPNSSNSQKNFRVLTVLISSERATDNEMAVVDEDIQWLSDIGGDLDPNMYNFSEATGFRATLQASNLAQTLK